MKEMISVDHEISMSSLDFLNNIINPSRIEAGEKPVRPSDFHARVNDEIDEKLNYENFVVGMTGHKTYYTMLNMEQMMLVGMRESKAVRRSVLARLKAMHGIQIPRTLPEALRFAAKLAEQKAELENQLAIAAPKAEFVDNYVEASGLMGFREVAKLLGIKETDFRLFLLENGIMYRLAGKMTPYSHHLDAGRFSVKTGEADNGHAFTQVKFTPKGVQWIAGLLAAWRTTAA
ncbi:phage antirepressor KilAC domain-containing protein [Escherichia coli]|nr:phage antirepressor KilAC domain-containing protein [Escherichia coli]EJN3776946.1 phage antirepressor KilAC domain-containing protein [Escherichia coli]EJN4323851.1 phage antirepressor KilAC domain-containing protein [Escherichia coli]EJN4387940.1 phage antirepressor KilAC domain-containing protein [Escherichia coli]EJN4421662.1 phage antirepressor KilAC domain-containing protein [Escherichia coli]